MGFIVFFVIFIACMGIGASLFGQQLYEKTDTSQSSIDGNPIIKFIYDLPVVGAWVSSAIFGIQLLNVHPFIGSIVVGMVAIPLLYIILKLIRGGG